MLILDVWREVARQTTLADAAHRIAVVLPPELPTSTLILRELDLANGTLRTVAIGSTGSTGIPLGGATELGRHLPDLVAWCRAGKVARHRRDSLPAPLDLAVPGEATGDVIVGPLLADDGEPIGVMVLAAWMLGAVHESNAQRLLEPLAVAIGKGRRVSEAPPARKERAAERRPTPATPEVVLVGAEAGLRAVMQRIEQVAPGDQPVLLIGEPGTGRETVARELHRRSPRAGEPFVTVAAAAELMRALEQAEGGTLYLDRVEAIPLEAQGVLIELLAGRGVPVNGRRRGADVRLIAAMKGDPLELVRAGKLREDLWYRLASAPIHVPPLRERPGDVPALAAHFAAGAGVRGAGMPLSLGTAEMQLLLAHTWPGNVRELAAVIEHAAAISGGKRLDVAAAMGAAGTAGRPASLGEDDVATLDAATVRHIEAALSTTGGRIEGARGAAALLGINPHTLRSRMRKLGIEWSQYRRRAPRR